MPTTFANSRSIVHRGAGQTSVCPAPDVCLTPSPAGPVPIPYVNAARSADLQHGTISCRIDGQPVAVDGSTLATSSGDEAGTAGGGVMSKTTRGEMSWLGQSLDVRIEGAGVVRCLDTCLHNRGGTPNTGGQPQPGSVA